MGLPMLVIQPFLSFLDFDVFSPLLVSPAACFLHLRGWCADAVVSLSPWSDFSSFFPSPCHNFGYARDWNSSFRYLPPFFSFSPPAAMINVSARGPPLPFKSYCRWSVLMMNYPFFSLSGVLPFFEPQSPPFFFTFHPFDACRLEQ